MPNFELFQGTDLTCPRYCRVFLQVRNSFIWFSIVWFNSYDFLLTIELQSIIFLTLSPTFLYMLFEK